MAGFHLPGDPYYAGPGLGTGGWIEESESEPEEEPLQAPESEPEEEPEEHGQGLEEDEEEPMEHHDSDTDGDEHILDANPDSDEEIDIEESDDEDMGDGEVVNPLPPNFLTPLPPRGMRGTYEVGQSSRPLPPFTAPATPLTGTVRALSSRVTELGRQVQDNSRHLASVRDYARVTAGRVTHLEEDQLQGEDITRLAARTRSLEEANEALQMEIAARERVHDVRIQVLEEQVRAAEQRAAELQRQFSEWLRQQGSSPGPQ